MAISKELLKKEIEQLDPNYLELAYNVLRQFPHQPKNELSDKERSEKMVALLKEIADRGGLGIDDPVAWQREIRQDRKLPFRED